MISPTEALARLQEGNARFVESGSSTRKHVVGMESGQQPFAVILSCADSRVPAELVFDQGLGDLFVIRVAGNIVAPSQIGSVEFAAEVLGARLVVVLGHTNCGAVSATLAELALESEHRSPNLRTIVDRVKPAVKPLMDIGGDDVLERAIEANVLHSVGHLAHGSQIIEEMIGNDELTVVGAVYSIEDGRVTFLDDS